MKKSIIVGFVFIIIVFQNHLWSQNYDFTAVAPSGQTLYYQLINNDTEVMVVKPKENDGTTTLAGYAPTGSITIPDSVLYMGVALPVTKIGNNAFSYYSSLTAIFIPNSIKNISQFALAGTSLTQIMIPESIVSIGNYAFMDCSHLKTIEVRCRNASIGTNIFFGCYNIENVTFEKYIDFPKVNLKRIILGDSIATIPTIFQNCDHLNRVDIGNSITSIPNDCFDDCDSLRIVVLGSNVSSIGARSFRKCINLDTIYAKPDTAPSLGLNAFNFTPSNKVVVTYCNANYSSVWGTTGFNYVTANVYSIYLGVSCTSCGSATIIQDVDCNNAAVILATPAHNYSFNCWSDGNTDNPRNITLTNDTLLTALFTRSAYDVIANSNNITMGSVNGGGAYDVGDTTELVADAICGYRFNHWSNGSTSNPLSFIPTSDTTLTAFFEIALDTIFVPDTTLETIVIYDTTIIPVTIYDTNVVIVPVFDTMVFTIPIFDTVFLQIIDTTLTPIHDTLYIYDTILIHDTIFIYDTILTDLDDVIIINAKVYVSHGDIVIEGANADRIMLFDINGRLLGVRRNVGNEIVRFDVPASGTYVIKIGNNTTKKVVVIK